MLTQPKVCVVISCFNHENYVIEAIKSVQNQSYKNIDIVIIDDCSIDLSQKVISQYLLTNTSLTFLKNKTNLGITKSFNQILTFIEADFILDLAADDILLPNCIEEQVNAFKNLDSDKYFSVYGNCEVINQEGNHLNYYYTVNSDKKVHEKPFDEMAYLDILNQKHKLCSVSALINFKIFKKLGGYDENLMYEDLDFWIRASKNFKVKFIDKILVQKRILPKSLYNSSLETSSYSKKINYSTYLILKKAYRQNQLKIENLNLLKRIKNEIAKNFKNRDFKLVYLLILLKIKCQFIVFESKM